MNWHFWKKKEVVKKKHSEKWIALRNQIEAVWKEVDAIRYDINFWGIQLDNFEHITMYAFVNKITFEEAIYKIKGKIQELQIKGANAHNKEVGIQMGMDKLGEGGWQ